MTTKDDRLDLRSAVVEITATMDAMYADLATETAASVRKHAAQGGGLDQTGRRKIMADVDRVLDQYFGPQHGAPSPMEEAIARKSTATAFKPLGRTVEELEGQMDAKTLRAYRSIGRETPT